MIRMSLQETNPFARHRQIAAVEVVYPSEFHFRIIVEAKTADETVLSSAIARYRVTAPLSASRQSSAGRYLAYSLSVRVESRDELNALDAAIKSVPGVRMVL